MKKLSVNVKAILILVLASGVMLGSWYLYQSSQTNENKSEDPTSVATSSSSKEREIDYAGLYNLLITAYQNAVESDTQDSNINGFLAHLYATNYSTPVGYALYDFDDNGVDELAFAFMPEGSKAFKTPVLIDLYTIDSNDKVVRLTNKDNQMDGIGERMTLTPCEGGIFVYNGSAGLSGHVVKYYKFNDNGDALVTIDRADDAKHLDLSKIEWNDVTQWEISNDDSDDANQADSDMNTVEIKNGNFSSLAGIWKNAKGDSLKITKDNQVYLNDKAYGIQLMSLPSDANLSDSITRWTISSDGPVASPPVFYNIPAGVSYTYQMLDGKDPGDSSKDRILLQPQQAATSEQEKDYIYYKVD